MDPARVKAIPIFSTLDDEALLTIATFAGESSVPAGKRLLNEGDYAYEMMAIEEGEAEVVRGGERLAVLGPGQFFGEMALLEKTVRMASVIALTPMRLITVSHWDLKRLGPAREQIHAILEERKRANA
jgi:voltage-gated potassium channel